MRLDQKFELLFQLNDYQDNQKLDQILFYSLLPADKLANLSQIEFFWDQKFQKLNQYLNLWEVKEEINCVIIEGAGDRSFCAGGDVVKLRKEVLADGGPPTQLSKSFFYDEYTLNYKISNFKKPFIA